MTTRWLGWTAVALALAALWIVVLRPATAQDDRTVPEPAAELSAEGATSSDGANVVAVGTPEQRELDAQLRRERRLRSLVSSITIFVIAIFLGVELINRVPATLHTPLMSGSNAISGITVVGAVIVAGVGGRVAPFLGFAAVVLAMINVVGGYLVTHRMLLMFKRR